MTLRRRLLLPHLLVSFLDHLVDELLLGLVVLLSLLLILGSALHLLQLLLLLSHHRLLIQLLLKRRVLLVHLLLLLLRLGLGEHLVQLQRSVGVTHFTLIIR